MSSDPHQPLKRHASFRFYEELNDFLPTDKRKRSFTYSFTGKPTVKDLIEGIGVPHTEIDLLLVNGRSVGFEYHLIGGERVAVYPQFESFDITALSHLRVKPLRETKFVVDVNLGKLSRYLRLAGFDCLYRNSWQDHELADISREQHRIILTRDVGVLKRSKVDHGYWIRATDPKLQLQEVVKRLQLEHSLKPFSRCADCNTQLEPISKPAPFQLPEQVYQNFNKYTFCPHCKKLYWQGSHYQRIKAMLEKLTR